MSLLVLKKPIDSFFGTKLKTRLRKTKKGGSLETEFSSILMNPNTIQGKETKRPKFYFRSRIFCFIMGRYLINAPPKSKNQSEIENQKNSIDDF